MTGHELIRALANLSPEELNRPVLMEQWEEQPHPCRSVVFDLEMGEIVLLADGPFSERFPDR